MKTTTTLLKMMTALSLMMSLSAHAQSQAQDKSKDSDRLDIKKLEDQYWAAKDDDYTVVQNRTYSKAKRLYLNVNYGTIINDAFSTGRSTGFTAGYFFNERHGLEAEYLTASLKDNDTTSYFFNRYGAIPNHNKFKNHTQINYSFMPFYAKMSFLEKRILYFDMGFTLGLGTLSYEQQGKLGNNKKSAVVYSAGFTQQLFLSKHFAVRLDFKNTFSKQDRIDWNTNNSINGKNNNDTFLTFGLTIFGK